MGTAGPATGGGHRPRLYVSDLDGTLLRSDGLLSDEARATLVRLLDAGALITVASARCLGAIRWALRGVMPALPVVELDGAFVSDPVSGEHLTERVLPAPIASAAVAGLIDDGYGAVLTSFDGHADHVYHDDRLTPGTRWYVEEKRAYGDPRLRRTEDLFAVLPAERVAMVTSFVPTDRAERLRGRLESALPGAASVRVGAHPHVPGWSELSVMHPEATKGHGIGWLRRHAGLDDAWLTVCGDYLNDLPMFAVADRTAAPANAIPQVRARADLLLPGNDEDGVIRFLATEHLDEAGR